MSTIVKKLKLTTAERNARIEEAIQNFYKGRVSTAAEAARKHAMLETTLRKLLKWRGMLSSRPVQGQKLTDD